MCPLHEQLGDLCAALGIVRNGLIHLVPSIFRFRGRAPMGRAERVLGEPPAVGLDLLACLGVPDASLVCGQVLPCEADDLRESAGALLDIR